MKRLLAATALSLCVSVFAFAGDIPTSGSPTPEPTPSAIVTSQSPGDIPSDGIAAELIVETLNGLLAAVGRIAF
jgi:hypothetical protein